MKHTPTPWKIMDALNGKSFIIYSDTHLNAVGIANVQSGKADAELIVRAVNNIDALVEAAKKVIAVADRKTIVFDELKQIIAKAEGK